MQWQDLFIGIANIGVIFAMLPVVLSLFGFKTVDLGLMVTGFLYGSLLIIMAIGIYGLGAVFGGTATLAAGILWLFIAALECVRVKREHKRKGVPTRGDS